VFRFEFDGFDENYDGVDDEHIKKMNFFSCFNDKNYQ